MLELQEIEELFKAVNHSSIKDLLRYSKIMADRNASPEDRAKASANFKAISNSSGIPSKSNKQIKPNAVAAEQAKQPAQSSPAQTPAAAAPSQVVVPPTAQTPFHEEFARHHGVDPVAFKNAFTNMSPEQQQTTRDWHQAEISKNPVPSMPMSQLAKPEVAPAPSAAPAVPAQVPKLGLPTKMAKSVEKLTSLLEELRKRL